MNTTRRLTRVRGTRLFADLHQLLRLAALVVAESRRVADALDDCDPRLSPFEADDDSPCFQSGDLRTAASVLEVFSMNVAADLPADAPPLCEPTALALPEAA
jgi:hypothetical protein